MVLFTKKNKKTSKFYKITKSKAAYEECVYTSVFFFVGFTNGNTIAITPVKKNCCPYAVCIPKIRLLCTSKFMLTAQYQLEFYLGGRFSMRIHVLYMFFNLN